MTDIIIEGGRALLGDQIVDTSLSIVAGTIRAVGSAKARSSLALDARDLLVLPGMSICMAMPSSGR